LRLNVISVTNVSRVRLRRRRESGKRDPNRHRSVRRWTYRRGRPDPDPRRALLDPYGRGRRHGPRDRCQRPFYLVETVPKGLYDFFNRFSRGFDRGNQGFVSLFGSGVVDLATLLRRQAVPFHFLLRLRRGPFRVGHYRYSRFLLLLRPFAVLPCLFALHLMPSNLAHQSFYSFYFGS